MHEQCKGGRRCCLGWTSERLPLPEAAPEAGHGAPPGPERPSLQGRATFVFAEVPVKSSCSCIQASVAAYPRLLCLCLPPLRKPASLHLRQFTLYLVNSQVALCMFVCIYNDDGSELTSLLSTEADP